MKKFMGIRIIKTGIAVTLALILSKVLGFESSFAGVVALIGIKPTTKKSLQYGSTLLIGSIISLIIGLVIGNYVGTGPFAFGLSTIIGISILVAFNLTEGLILAVVVMYHVLEAIPIPWSELGIFSINELSIVFIGIATSVLVNIAAPQRFDLQLHESIQAYYRLFNDCLIKIAESVRKPVTSRIISINDYSIHRKKIRQLINNAELGKENCLNKHDQQHYDQLIGKLRLLLKLLNIIEEMSIETKRLTNTYLHTEHIAKAIDLLVKIQDNPEKTTLSTYKRIFVVMNNLNKYFTKSPLPESRQEFVDRSCLHHLFLYINDYIDILFLLRDPIETAHNK